jgi:transcriptional regulator of heat shock response
MLTEASQMLSGMSRGAGLVLAAKNEVALKHIEFIQLEPQRALVVLVSQNGDVENRVIDLPAGVTCRSCMRRRTFSTPIFAGARWPRRGARSSG